VILGGTSFVGGIGSIWGNPRGGAHHRRHEQRTDPTGVLTYGSTSSKGW
jgi:hypothetical protein